MQPSLPELILPIKMEKEVLKELGVGAVPDAGTVGDWLRRQGEEGVAGLERVNRELIGKALEEEGEELILDVDATPIVAEKQEIKNLPASAWKAYRTPDGIATDREIAETVHTMNGTKQAFRLIVLRWLNPQPSLFEAGRADLSF